MNPRCSSTVSEGVFDQSCQNLSDLCLISQDRSTSFVGESQNSTGFFEGFFPFFTLGIEDLEDIDCLGGRRLAFVRIQQLGDNGGQAFNLLEAGTGFFLNFLFS